MPARTDSPRWASLNATADHLGVCEKTVRRMIASGQITGYRLGRRMIRVDLNELDAKLSPIPAAGDAA